MPVNRQVAIRRRGNYGRYATALVQGARTAYQNRAMIQDATKAVKRKYDEYRRPKKSRKTAQPASVANAPGNDWTVTKSTVGYKKKPTVPRLAKMLEAAFQKRIYRNQGLTNFDTNVGFYTIANWQNAASNPTAISMPVHIYDLTSFPNTTEPPVGFSYRWDGEAATSAITRAELPSQSPTGVTGSLSRWHAENIAFSSGLNNTNSRVFRHDWSDIRINFYGPRKRTTKFEVIFARCKDEFANPLVAHSSNKSYHELMSYLERPCIYSNLQTHQPGNISKKLQIVKRYTYWVSAGQTTDVDTTVGKVKEARIFMRHGRVYNLDWRQETETTVPPHGASDGIDFVADTTHHNGPWHGSRLMMIIRAFAPERATVTSWDVPAEANRDPSYDIMIRNAISVP